MMTKEEYMKMLLDLEKEGEVLRERSEILSQTSDFLAEESEKLFNIADDVNEPWDKREKAHKQLLQILRRMELELKQINEEEVRLAEYVSRFESMKKLFRQIED